MYSKPKQESDICNTNTGKIAVRHP